MLSRKTVSVGKQWVVVSQASVGMGLRREELTRNAQQFPQADPARQFVAAMIYPSLAACAVENGVDFDTFIDELPEPFVDAWYEAAKELNPHWFPESKPEAETAPDPFDGSKDSSD